jgi:hypothetical protein
VTLLRKRGDLTKLTPHFIALLGQEDESIADRSLDALSFDTAHREAVLERALASGVHPAVRDRVLQDLGRPTSAEKYFVDSPCGVEDEPLVD